MINDDSTWEENHSGLQIQDGEVLGDKTSFNRNEAGKQKFKIFKDRILQNKVAKRLPQTDMQLILL